MKVAFLCLGLSLSAAYGSLQFVSSNFAKVPNTFPTYIEDSFITDAYGKSKLMCLQSCQMLSGCLLACYNGVRCSMYNATVTVAWKVENSASSDLVTFHGAQCYTAWFSPTDITGELLSTLIRVSGLLIHAESNTPHKAIYCFDGFYARNTHHIFIGIPNPTKTFIEIQFKRECLVTHVIAKARESVANFIPCLGSTIKIGDVSSPGSYASYTYFGTIGNDVANGEIVQVKGNPVRGKFIAFEKANTCGQLIIAELRILGEC